MVSVMRFVLRGLASLLFLMRGTLAPDSKRPR